MRCRTRRTTPRRTVGRWLARSALVLFSLLLGDVLFHLLVLGRDGRALGRRIAPYDPPLFNADQEAYLARLRDRLARGRFNKLRGCDPVLGWGPPRGSALDDHDRFGCRIGARPIGEVPRSGVRRVVAVGCSFTHGDEVEGDRTWAARLEQARDDLEIANLGVSGYDLSQALLRMRRDGLPLQPDEVWLGFVPATLMRLGTLYVPMANRTGPMVAFKPAHRLSADGELREFPCPAADVEDTVRLASHLAPFHAALAEGDFWLQRVPAAYQRPSVAAGGTGSPRRGSR